MQCVGLLQLAQALAELQALQGVVAEQQGLLQIEAGALGTVQIVVDFATGQVVCGLWRPQLQHPFGILELGQISIGMFVQLAQGARQELQQRGGVAGLQVLGAQLARLFRPVRISQ